MPRRVPFSLNTGTRVTSNTWADPSVKLEALESIVAPKLRTGRFKATDALIASLHPSAFANADDAFRR